MPVVCDPFPVPGRRELTVHLPGGFRLESAGVVGENATIERSTHTVAVRITPSATGTVNRKIKFTK